MAARRESRPIRTVRSHPGTNRAGAHLHLVVAGSARALKDTEARGDVSRAKAPIRRNQEVTIWALLLVLGLATLMAGYILLAKISGSL
jgi:hypothetical protein